MEDNTTDLATDLGPGDAGPGAPEPAGAGPAGAGPGGVGVSASGGLVVASLGLLGARAYDPVVAGFLAAPHRTY